LLHTGRFGLAVALAFSTGFTGLWLLDRAPAPRPGPSPVETAPPSASEHVPYAEGEQHLLTTSVLGRSVLEIAPTHDSPAPEPAALVEPPASSPAPAPIARDSVGFHEGGVRPVEIERVRPDPVVQPAQPDVETQIVAERERIGRELRRRAEPVLASRPERPRQPERVREVRASSNGRGSRTLR